MIQVLQSVRLEPFGSQYPYFVLEVETSRRGTQGPELKIIPLLKLASLQNESLCLY